MGFYLVGVSCVGKTTIGRLLAARLSVPFFDLDPEIHRHFAASIERARARWLTGYAYRVETAVLPKSLLLANPDCVVAVPQRGLRDAYLRVLKRVVSRPRCRGCRGWRETPDMGGLSPRSAQRAPGEAGVVHLNPCLGDPGWRRDQPC